MTVVMVRKPATPFLDRSSLPPAMYCGGEAAVARGDELRPVIECGLADSPAGQTPADSPAFVEHEHAKTVSLQFGRGGQPGHAGANHQHVGVQPFECRRHHEHV